MSRGHASIVALTLLLLPAFAEGQEVSSGDQGPRYLDVTAEGYSRFEIEGNDVVAFFTGGVEFSYMGHRLQAGELRYNQATQVATAVGDVVLELSTMMIFCDAAVMDGAQGEATVEGALYGTISQPPLTFQAGSGRITFPPGKAPSSIRETNLELGNGVLLTTEGQTLVRTDSVHFRGEEQLIQTGGGFSATAELGTRSFDGKDVRLDLSGLTVQGQKATGILSDEGALEVIEILNATVDAPSLSVQLEKAIVRNVTPRDEQHMWLEVELTGKPLRCELRLESEGVYCEAQSMAFSTSAEGITRASLSGDVRLYRDSGMVAADTVVVEPKNGAFSLKFPLGVRLGLDLAELTEREPISLPSLNGALGR